MLTADHLMALDLPCPKAVVAAVIGAPGGVAVTLNCNVARLVVLANRPSLDRTLKPCGHHPASRILHRRACAQSAA